MKYQSLSIANAKVLLFFIPASVSGNFFQKNIFFSQKARFSSWFYKDIQEGFPPFHRINLLNINI
jgi:hypothetical protein